MNKPQKLLTLACAFIIAFSVSFSTFAQENKPSGNENKTESNDPNLSKRNEELQKTNEELQKELDFTKEKKSNLSETNQYLQKTNEELQKELDVIKAEDEIKELVIDTRTYFPDLERNTKTNIRLDMSNMGPANLKSTKVTLKDLPAGVSLKSGLSPEQSIGAFNVGDNASVTYTLETSAQAQIGSYPITYAITGNYGLQSVKTYETSKTFYLKVVKNKTQKDDQLKPVTIKNIKHPSTIKKGEVALLKFDVQNPNSQKLKAVKISVLPEEGLVNQSQNLFVINNFAPGDTQNFQVYLFGKDDAERKNYSINITAEDISTGSDTEQTAEESKNKMPTASRYTGIYYNNPKKGEDSDGSVKNPQIIISEYSFGEKNIAPGQEFNLSMSYLNTSHEKTLRNIKISLSSDENTFIPIHSSNSIYIDRLTPSQSISKTIRFTTKADATTKTVPINIDYTYEDSAGNALTSKDIISIPVMQKTDFSIDEIRPPQDVMEGQPVPISVSFYNLGKTPISNIKVTAEGSFNPDGDPIYFSGNLEPGKSDSYNLSAFPDDPKKIDGKIIFTYDTLDGKKERVEKPFSFELNPMPIPKDEDDMENQKAQKKFPYIPVGIAAVFIITAGIIIYKKRKKAKEKSEIDVDEL